MRCIIFSLILGTQIFSVINAEEIAKPAEDTKSVEISKKDTEATKPPEPIVRESRSLAKKFPTKSPRENCKLKMTWANLALRFFQLVTSERM